MTACPVSDQRQGRRFRALATITTHFQRCLFGAFTFAASGQSTTTPLPPTPSLHWTAPGLSWLPQDYVVQIVAISTGLLLLGSLLLWRQKRLALSQATELRSLAANLKRSQEALRQSEERFRRAFEDGPVGIILASPRSLVLRANRALCDMLGYSEEELLGLGLMDLIHPEDAPHLIRTAEQLFARELSHYQLQQRFIRHDKAIIWTKITARLLTSSDGRPLYALAIIEDITDQKRAEESIRKSEERFQLIARATNDTIWDWDLNTNRVWWNEGINSVFGYPAEAVDNDGHWWDQHIHPDDRERILNAQRAVIDQGGHFWSDEYRYRRADGSYADVFDRAYVTRDPQGRPLRMIGAMMDITTRKQAEQEIARARDEAVEVARLKSEFLANISHEVRTPLNGIIGMTVLLDDSELHPEQRNFVETIKTCSEVLLRIINDILDFSKMEAGKLCFETLDFNLRQTVESTIEVLADRADRKHVELVLLIDANVPVQLRGDPGRLRQVLINLVVNAVKFTEHGEVVVRVALESESESQVILCFTVRDTGVGIAPGALPYLFQAFSQVDGSTTRRYGGTGLGLAISKSIVEMMGGQIGVQSAPGKGSTFWFTVRLQKQPHACPVAPATSLHLSGLRVLIVDDNEANRNLLAQQASLLGMRPTVACDGPEALDILRSANQNNQPCRLAILDLQMAEMDGITLAQLIKTDPALADIRLLLLTSRVGRNDTSLFRAAGIGSFMLKPIKQQELFDRISGLMTSPSQHETRFWLNRRSGASTSRFIQRSPSARPIHVLVAEDNPINQRVAVALLAKLGYQAEAVASGPEVLHALEAVAYDVVFMDCQLPELDGFETTREIRRREQANPGTGRRVHIIAMTAYALRGARDECLAAGMDDYLTKPVRLESLMAALGKLSQDPPPTHQDPFEPTSPPPEGPNGVLDPTVIDAFKALHDPLHPNPALELIDLFLHDAPGQIREMDRAAARYDAHRLERIAHSLRGSASCIGAQLLSQRCAEVEEKAGARALQEATHLLSNLKAEFDKAAPLLKSLRDNL